MRKIWKEYAPAVERNSKSVFDDDDYEPRSIKVVFEIPFENEFALKKHYDMLWMQDLYRRFIFLFPFNILRDANTQEIVYKDSFVNPLIPKPHVNLGSKHDGILKIYMNSIEMEIGFLEVVGNAVNVDVTGYYEDMEKLFKEHETTIYTMHRAKGGLHIVDIVTNFTIPDSKDQAYVISEIIEKVYFFKSRVMDYYSKLQGISPKVQEYSHINENQQDGDS
ncbi:hypothetical protein C1645_824665 [Glomus cerebriforme]|uniref:Uncharacterized protein n=1 Tax=Glomus cerebriforme TaxID=658196 RepID=A0A397SV17_9GLOM|nr:hypothetical protein C1645_824665 [Glomus cerebriforme]